MVGKSKLCGISIHSVPLSVQVQVCAAGALCWEVATEGPHPGIAHAHQAQASRTTASDIAVHMRLSASIVHSSRGNRIDMGAAMA